MIERIYLPFPELNGPKMPVLHADTVQSWIVIHESFLVLEVKDAPIENRCPCKCHVVKLVNPWLIESLARKDAIETEVKLNDHIEEIFVKVVAHNKCDPAVRLTAMYKQERA